MDHELHTNGGTCSIEIVYLRRYNGENVTIDRKVANPTVLSGEQNAAIFIIGTRALRKSRVSALHTVDYERHTGTATGARSGSGRHVSTTLHTRMDIFYFWDSFGFLFYFIYFFRCMLSENVFLNES